MSTTAMMDIEVPEHYQKAVKDYQKAQGNDWKTFLGEDWMTVLEKSRLAENSSNEGEDTDSDKSVGGDELEESSTWLTSIDNYSFIEELDKNEEVEEGKGDAESVFGESILGDSHSYHSGSFFDGNAQSDTASLKLDMLLADSDDEDEPNVAPLGEWDSCRGSLYTCDDETVYTTFSKKDVVFEGLPGQFNAEEAILTHLSKCIKELGLKEEDIFGKLEEEVQSQGNLSRRSQRSKRSQRSRRKRRSRRSKQPERKQFQANCFNPHVLDDKNPQDASVSEDTCTTSEESVHEICFNPNEITFTPEPRNEISFNPYIPAPNKKKKIDEIIFNPYIPAPRKNKAVEKNLLQDMCFNNYLPGLSDSKNTQTTMGDKPVEAVVEEKNEEEEPVVKEAPEVVVEVCKEEQKSTKSRKSFLSRAIRTLKKILTKTRLVGKKKTDHDSLQVSATTACSVTTVEETLSSKDARRRVTLTAIGFANCKW